MEYLLPILAVAAIPVAGVAAFFMVLGARQRILLLEKRFTVFEERVAAGSI